MVSKQPLEPQLRGSRLDYLSEFVRYLHLKETDLYRQRLRTAKDLEKQKKRVLAEVNQLFHDAFQSYEHQFHRHGRDIRTLREHLEALIEFES